MTTEEKIKTILVYAQIPSRCYSSACSEIESLLASEIIAEKIKMLEEIQKAPLPMFIKVGDKLRELREEGKENKV